MKFFTVLAFYLLKEASGVIYRLNDSEYTRLPPLFHLDDFERCFGAPGDTYCYLDAKILPNSTNELSTLLQEYSASNLTHFDHTLIHWGVCVTHTCRQYYGNATLEQALEACVNATLYDTYQLQARLINEATCTKFEESVPYDAGDLVVAAVFLALLLLNICGTVYDLFFYTLENCFITNFLLCFSVKRNWQRLVSPAGEGPEPKLKSLTCFNGMKVMTTLMVLFGHSSITYFSASGNPLALEMTYHEPEYILIVNGTHIVQIFLVISGFLLAYNVLVAEEKRHISWRTLPMGIIQRLLRLTPVYALVLAFICTWLRHLRYGPLWQSVVNIEVVDCRRDWWLHLLYVDNYVDQSQCMFQSWYISTDMQLSILGLAIFCLCRDARSRKIAIAVAFVVGVLTPAAHTYFDGVHPVVMATPETLRNYLVLDTTYNLLYKRGHTNIVTYVMGLALGVFMYEMHGKDFKKTKKHRLLFWCLFLMSLACALLGSILYIDGIQIPPLVRALYSSAIKVCFGACVCGLIGGTLLRIDSFVRGLTSWRGWAAPGRLSYCVYLLHMYVLRTGTAYNAELMYFSFYRLILNSCSLIGVTYMLAVPCWLLVESPMAQAIKLAFEGGKTRNKSDVTDTAVLQTWEDQKLGNDVETCLGDNVKTQTSHSGDA